MIAILWPYLKQITYLKLEVIVASQEKALYLSENGLCKSTLTAWKIKVCEWNVTLVKQTLSLAWQLQYVNVHRSCWKEKYIVHKTEFISTPFFKHVMSEKSFIKLICTSLILFPQKKKRRREASTMTIKTKSLKGNCFHLKCHYLQIKQLLKGIWMFVSTIWLEDKKSWLYK